MSAPYDGELRALAREVASAQGTVLREGVYVAVTGPNLETRAEYRMAVSVGAALLAWVLWQEDREARVDEVVALTAPSVSTAAVASVTTSAGEPVDVA